jgi:protein-L-isoaspartate(D-aspartate) O-methyltransferase
LAAIGLVPRERFVRRDLADVAYQDRPLPIGHGQTISQPRMVALMLQQLALTGVERVLEVGSGSGYQTALLAQLAGHVTGVELVPELVAEAKRILESLGYANVELHLAGEALGWPAGGPYDAIIVAAAAPRIPQSLVDQLAPGGRLVIPVGSREGQDLMFAELREEGITVTRRGACRFVPLLGQEAFAASVSDAQTS